MFPTTTLLVGTSLLWSIAPLAANRLTGGREERIDYKAANQLADAVRAVRQELAAERQAERQLVFDQLQLMFDRGDRRVTPFPEFHTVQWADGRQVGPTADRLALIVQHHIDLYDEALDLAESRACL